MDSHLLFVVGASGVGKTAAIQALSARQLPDLACYQFDSVGIPTVEAMVARFGSAERWQEVTTHEWIARLKREVRRFVVLEGQTRPSFIRAALGDRRAGIVLLDCQPSIRSYRVRANRRQPELDTPEMHSWAAYLRGQADALRLPVIDTSSRTPDQVADELYDLVQTVPLWTTA